MDARTRWDPEEQLAAAPKQGAGRWVARSFGYALLVLGAALFPMLELPYLARGTAFTEAGLLEWAGVGLLTSMILLNAFLAVTRPGWRPLALLMAALLLCALIRELDRYLDVYVADGAWQVLVTTVLVITVFTLWRHRQQLSKQLSQVAETAAFGLMLAGFLTVTVFSRLFGVKTLWMTVMDEDFNRQVKNLAEEGVELLGYSLLAAGIVEFVTWVRRVHGAARKPQTTRTGGPFIPRSESQTR